MKNLSPSMILAGSLALLAGCGSDSLTVQGTVAVTSQVAGQTPTTWGFDFTRATTLEAASGVTGSCTRAGNAWQVEIIRENPPADTLKRFTLSIPVRMQDTTVDRPTAAFVLGDSTFSASGTCTDSTTTVSGGLHVVTHCTGVHATGDSRVLDADVNVVFTNCAF